VTTITPVEASSPPVATFRRGLHRYCVLLALCVLGLIAAGGMVTSTGSGLSVPDWPTSYGHNMFTFPPSKWTGGIFYEHTHRLIASTVGLLTIGLAVWMHRSETRRWVRRLSYFALALVIVQGLLGGLTVKFLLPTPISVFHGCLAQAFLCVITALAVFTSRRWIEGDVSRAATGRLARVNTSPSWPLPRLAVVCVAVVFFQLVVGAIMRHTQSGLAVPDFPLAYGRALPSLDDASIAAYNESRVWDYQFPAVSKSQIVWHLSHRVGAVLVSLALASAAVLAIRRHRAVGAIARPALALPILLVIQISLGAMTIWSGRHPLLATAHVAVGAATLATTFVMALWSRRLLQVVPRCVAPSDADLIAPVAVAGARS